ncbi:type I restriction enzyme HsdR N-terminal domain-containing protein [Saccharicrinis sp. FJH54]|uniref:type I restriction enzyme HsdR N-terminal domain-containing protein n=1 Tax=Saccharicrinis sp. FJH54 TaxID=3344665 RepID=UPI0035D41B91
MTRLNLPDHPFNIKKEGEKNLIFDVFRKRFVVLTPEEHVRQYFLAYLLNYKNYQRGLIAVETEIKINGLSRRCDAVVYNKQGKPVMILEFKAPEIKISQKTMDQICNYNLKLNVTYFVISNGLQHFCGKIDKHNNAFTFLSDIPDMNTILQ